MKSYDEIYVYIVNYRHLTNSSETEKSAKLGEKDVRNGKGFFSVREETKDKKKYILKRRNISFLKPMVAKTILI